MLIMEICGVRLAVESTGLDEEATLESLVEESLGTEIKRNALSTYCWMKTWSRSRGWPSAVVGGAGWWKPYSPISGGSRKSFLQGRIKD